MRTHSRAGEAGRGPLPPLRFAAPSGHLTALLMLTTTGIGPRCQSLSDVDGAGRPYQ